MHVMNIMSELYNKIDGMCNTGIFENRQVYIWGVSKASYISAQYLLKRNVNVISVLDNNSGLWGSFSKQLQNYADMQKMLMIESPEILRENNNVLVLVFSRAYDSILKQSMSYGIVRENCIHMYSPEKYLDLSDFSGLTEILVEYRKKLQYDILKYLKEICHKYNIRYYLAAGTLLGAVRHKGYIPWDDDIDVYMPWDDYRRLIELFRDGSGKNDRYSLKYYGLADNFSWIYVKLQDNRTISRGVRFPLICDIGVNIDIFPMGGIPAEERKFKMLEERVSEFQKKWAKHLVNFEMGSDTSVIAAEINDIMSTYSFESSPYVGYFINGYWNWEKHSKKAYERAIKLQFEDETFDAPQGYDEVLTHSYGNYMELPPNWQTIQYPHTYKAFWKKGMDEIGQV